MPGMFGGGGMSAQDISALANQEAGLNRVNTWSPIYGGTTWSHGGGGAGGASGAGGGGGGAGGGGDSGTYYKDQLGFKWDSPGPGRTQFTSGDMGPWTQTQTLSPFAQQRFDLAQALQNRVAGEMQPLDTSKLTDISMDPNYEQNQADQAYKYETSKLDPQWSIREQQLKSQLASQGMHLGDVPYQNAMKEFLGQRDAAYDQARSGSYQLGAQVGAQRQATRIGTLQAQIQEALQKSGWSLGQINALLQGLPGAPSGAAGQVSLLQPALQQSMANQQLQAQLGSNLFGAGGLLGAAAIMAPMMSDVESKEDFADAGPAIEEFLESAEPAEYSYKPEFQDHPLAGEGRFVSPMAQGLEKSRIGRQMVVDTPDGKVVDYGRSFGAVLASLAHLNKKLNSVLAL